MSISISKDKEILAKNLESQILNTLRPMLNDLADYVLSNVDESILNDLMFISDVSKQFPISHQRISQLIKKGKINTYTKARLVRGSEVRYYLENKKR